MDEPKGKRLFKLFPYEYFLAVVANRINGSHLQVLVWCCWRAHYRTGTFFTWAEEIRGQLDNLSLVTINAVMKKLRDLKFIWYPGEHSGLRKYLVMIEGYERSDKTRLAVYDKHGKLTAGARTIYEKTTGRNAVFDSAPKPTLVVTGIPTGTVDRPVDSRVTDEKPADSKGLKEGSGNGSRRGRSQAHSDDSEHSQKGSPRVPAGPPAGESGNILNESLSLNDLDPPIPPTGGTLSSSSGWTYPGEGDQNVAYKVGELHRRLQTALACTVPGYKAVKQSEKDALCGGALVRDHGLELVTRVIDAVVASDFHRRYVHRFTHIQKHWNKLAAEAAGGGNGNQPGARGNARANKTQAPRGGKYVTRKLDEDRD